MRLSNLLAAQSSKIYPIHRYVLHSAIKKMQCKSNRLTARSLCVKS